MLSIEPSRRFQDAAISSLYLMERARAGLERAGFKTLGDVLAAQHKDIKTIRGLGAKSLARVRLLARTAESVPPEKLAALVRPGAAGPLPKVPAEILAGVANAQTMSQEVAALANGLGRRDASVFLRRLGAGPGPAPTLEALGVEHGVTRERIRQVCTRHVSLLTESGLRLPIASAAAEALAQTGGMASSRRFVELCRDSGLSVAEADLDVMPGLVQMGLVMPKVSWNRDVRGWMTDGAKAAAVAHAGRLKARVRTARKELRRIGALNESLYGADADDCGEGVAAFLTPSGSRMEPCAGWLVLLPAGESSLARTALKVLSVAGTLRIAELADALSRGLEVVPPTPVLRMILSDHEDFEVSGDRVLRAVGALGPPRLSGAEAEGVRVTRAQGGVITSGEFSASMMGAGYSLARARQILTGPLMVRQSKGLYTLQGTRT